MPSPQPDTGLSLRGLLVIPIPVVWMWSIFVWPVVGLAALAVPPAAGLTLVVTDRQRVVGLGLMVGWVLGLLSLVFVALVVG